MFDNRIRSNRYIRTTLDVRAFRDIRMALNGIDDSLQVVESMFEDALEERITGVEKRLLDDAKNRLYNHCFRDYLAIIITPNTTYDKFVQDTVKDLPDYMSLEQFRDMFDEQLRNAYLKAVKDYAENGKSDD